MLGKNNRIEEALSYTDKYSYDNGVLKNLLDIKDQKELDKAESAICFVELSKFYREYTNFSFSVDFYLNLHKNIFKRIYPFAGQIRDVNMTKGNTPFCRPEFINDYLRDLLKTMNNKSQSIHTREEYIEFLSKCYSEINIVHPFREGNGRTLREFLRQMVNYLALSKGLDYELDYSNVDDEIRGYLINGSILASMRDDLTLLGNFFESTLKEKSIKINSSGKTK